MDKKLDKEAKGMLKVVEELEKDGIEEKYKEELEKRKNLNHHLNQMIFKKSRF